MNSEIKVYSYPNGEIQRVQVVRWEDWSQLDFLYPKKNAAALDCFTDVYRNFLVPACPWIFPQMVLFSLPEDVDMAEFIELDSGAAHPSAACVDGQDKRMFYKSERYGIVSDPLMMASILLQEGIKLKKGQPVFLTDRAKAFYRKLEEKNCVRIVCGKFPKTQVIPVGAHTGYLSEIEPEAVMKVNASFFIMDSFDCATIYDQIGIPFGLCVKNGLVQSPPLFQREALLVKKDGSVSITRMDAKDLTIEIGGNTYRHGENAMVYCRPARSHTPGGKGLRLVIVGNRIVAVKQGGCIKIPASGFVLCIDDDVKVYPDETVVYHGLEDVEFGIQVGNSIVHEGIPTDHFISKFYNIYHLEPIPYPPSLYPMDFANARAARIALGADENGKPILFWAEGAGKLHYMPGEDSRGATLVDMANIAIDIGMYHGVNLDGGGSAQILQRNQRALHISDRKKADNSDAERLVPIGLCIR